MTRMMKTVTALMALASLTACDYGERKDLHAERESRSYQAAMADYQSGRVDQAVAGFRKVCREDPANASARFQLACLLQDSGRDYLGAYCAYLEYLLQHPESDKAKLARDRAAICEREVAKALAEKHGLTSNVALMKETEELRRRLKDAEVSNAKLRDDVSVAMQRIAHLRQENGKLMAAIRGEGDESSALAKDAGIKDAKALLDEDDTDRIRLSADVAALRKESDEDAQLAGPSLLSGVTNRLPVATVAAPTQTVKRAEPPHEKRPPEYVVQDGDTLYKIAIRFYGRKGAWKLIRDANKAVISTDGRVNAGMKIRLP